VRRRVANAGLPHVEHQPPFARLVRHALDSAEHDRVMRHDHLRAQRLRLVHRRLRQIERNDDARHFGVSAPEEQPHVVPFLGQLKRRNLPDQPFDIRNRACVHADRLRNSVQLMAARKQPFLRARRVRARLQEHLPDADAALPRQIIVLRRRLHAVRACAQHQPPLVRHFGLARPRQHRDVVPPRRSAVDLFLNRKAQLGQPAAQQRQIDVRLHDQRRAADFFPALGYDFEDRPRAHAEDHHRVHGSVNGAQAVRDRDVRAFAQPARAEQPPRLFQRRRAHVAGEHRQPRHDFQQLGRQKAVVAADVRRNGGFSARQRLPRQLCRGAQAFIQYDRVHALSPCPCMSL